LEEDQSNQIIKFKLARDIRLAEIDRRTGG
jgi:hypothetical protein